MKNNGKPLASLLTVLLLLLLTLSTGSAQQATPADMLAAYRAVALGEQSYLQVDPYAETATEVTLTLDITQWYSYQFDVPKRFDAFAVTDLDKDDSPELLLKLSDDFGFELLRYFDGTVYGYPFVYRAMEAVTTDGEIHAASGASNFGWYALTFTDSAIEPAILCWVTDEDPEHLQYHIGDAEVSSEAFNAFNDSLWSKPVIAWTGFTPEALSTLSME